MKIEIGKKISLTELSRMAGGTIIEPQTDTEPSITHIATDSREVTDGTLFLAIKGERVDGNDYAETAVKNGASAVLGQRIPEGAFGIAVDDTVEALGRLAVGYRADHDLRTVAVTGSVGKTTTKELLQSVLSQHYRTHCSKGNFNSNIGLPMSVLAMPVGTEIAVLELGMSAFHEIEYLSRIATPDIGVITTIGTSHMEALGSRENICKAKAEILEGMKAGSVLLLNGDEPLLKNIEKTVRAKGVRPLYVSVSDKNADFYATNIREEIGKTTFDVCFGETLYKDLILNVMGIHTVYAALFAVAVGVLTGMGENEIRHGLSEFRTAPMRQSVREIGGVTLIEDCYNASPESMRAALDVAATLRRRRGHGRILALLGDMRELGETSAELHEGVGRYVSETGVSRLFAFGREASCHIVAGAVEAGIPETSIVKSENVDAPEEIGEQVLQSLKPGDILLVKASRALRLERVIAYLEQRIAELGNG